LRNGPENIFYFDFGQVKGITSMTFLTAVPKWAWGLLGAVVIILAVMVWGNSRERSGYKQGEAATDAKWEAASAKLREEAAKSATKADDAAAKRLEEHVEQANEDQEKVDEAIREGRSPLDALFGADGR
jgi:hypothetical protein